MKTQLRIQRALRNRYGGMCVFVLALSIQPSPCSLFLSIPNTALHQVMLCFQATDRLLLALLLQSRLPLPALWPLLLLGFTVSVRSAPPHQ